MEAAQTTCPGDVLKDDKDVSVAKNIVSENTNRESTPKEETKNNTSNLKDGSGGQVVNAVAKHYNELEEFGLASRSRSRIFYLRNFNNWIKSILIGNILQKIRNDKGSDHNITVLDMCSGKGGDILKWRKGQISKLVCVDIAETSVEQSKMRYKEMQDRNQSSRQRQSIFKAEFLTADVTKQRLKEMYADPDLHFDLVSCQFAFHYSFESYPQADMMLKNISDCLQPGGYFVGTTPNSYELIHRIRAVEGNSFGNEVYNVEFESKDKENFPLFGAQYWFRLEGVVDCPEFLVYFPALEKMAEKYGLKLISKKPFAEFFNENVNVAGENRGLLGRMQALEPYPVEDGVNAMSSNQDDYAFAKEALDKAISSGNYDFRRPLKVGTLSKAEWEAITLYLVFVFQKVKADKKLDSYDKSHESPPTRTAKSKYDDDDDDDDLDDTKLSPPPKFKR